MGATDYGLICVRKLKIMTDVSQPPPTQRPQPWHHPPSSRPGQGRVVGEGGAGYLEPLPRVLGERFAVLKMGWECCEE